jgi:seryl-tRNA synthetase
MSDERTRLAELISNLKRQRGELAVQIHLGKAEAKDEWEKLNAQLADLTKDYEPLKEATGEAAANVLEALKLVAEEVRDGFDRIRKSL